MRNGSTRSTGTKRKAAAKPQDTLADIVRRIDGSIGQDEADVYRSLLRLNNPGFPGMKIAGAVVLANAAFGDAETSGKAFETHHDALIEWRDRMRNRVASVAGDDIELAAKGMRLISAAVLGRLQGWVYTLQCVGTVAKDKANLVAWCRLQIEVLDMIPDAFRLGTVFPWAEGGVVTRNVVAEALCLSEWLLRDDPKAAEIGATLLRDNPDLDLRTIRHPVTFSVSAVCQDIIRSAGRHIRLLGDDLGPPEPDEPITKAKTRNYLAAVIEWCGVTSPAEPTPEPIAKTDATIRKDVNNNKPSELQKYGLDVERFLKRLKTLQRERMLALLEAGDAGVPIMDLGEKDSVLSSRRELNIKLRATSGLPYSHIERWENRLQLVKKGQ